MLLRLLAISAATTVAVTTIAPTLRDLPTPSVDVTEAGSPDAASPPFNWTGQIRSGASLRLRNLSGDIEIRRGTGAAVEVHATSQLEDRKWGWNFRERILPVTFHVTRSGDDVIICDAVNERPGCDGGRDGQQTWADDERPEPMRIVVSLPAGVAIDAATGHGDMAAASIAGAERYSTGHGSIMVNDAGSTLSLNTGHGDVTVHNAAGTVEASSGHGDIDITRAASVTRVSTGHGDIRAELAQLSGASDLRFNTGHGNVHVTAPANISADVELRTGHGSVSSDFPLRFASEDGRRRNDYATGTLGGGGRSIRMSTGHGDVTFTRGS